MHLSGNRHRWSVPTTIDVDGSLEMKGVHMARSRLTAILERWLSRGIPLAAGLAIVLGLAAAIVLVQDQFFSSSPSDLERNEQELREAILKSPDDPDLRVSLANVYLQEQKYDEAIAQYSGVLEVDENRQDALMGLGVAYRETGDSEQAVTAFTKFVELNKDSPYADVDRRLEAVHFYLGEIYLERNEPDKAVEELEAALAIEPADADALYLLGNGLRAQEDYEGAIDAYGLATSFVPDFKEAYEGMAAAADKQGDSLTATYARAMARLSSGDVDTAVQELEEVVEQSPDIAGAYFGLGYGYEQLGQTDKAVAAYQKSVDTDPRQYAAQSALARLGAE